MKVPVSWWGRRLNCSCCCLQEATIFCDAFLGTSRDETCAELCKTCSVLQPQVQYTVCSALMGRRAHRDRGFPHFLLCDLSWCFGLCRINLEAFVLLWLCCPIPVAWPTRFLKKSVLITDSLLIDDESYFEFAPKSTPAKGEANLLAKPKFVTAKLLAQPFRSTGFTN